MDRTGLRQSLDVQALPNRVPAADLAARLRLEADDTRGGRGDGKLDLVGQDIERNAFRLGNEADARPAFFGGNLHHLIDLARGRSPAIELLDRHIPRCVSCHE